MPKLSYVRLIHIFGMAVFAVGLACATSIYIYQGDDVYQGEVLSYVVEGGRTYPVYARDNKSFQSATQSVGGRSMETITDLREWLRSLAYGKRKACTVALTSALVCFLCFKVPSYLRYYP